MNDNRNVPVNDENELLVARRRKQAQQQAQQARAAAPRPAPQQRPPQARPAASAPQKPMVQRPAPAPAPKPAPQPTATQPAATDSRIIDKAEKDKKKTNLSKAGAEMMSSAIKALIYIALVLVVASFLSIIIIRVGNDIFALVKSDEVIDITIPEDASIADVAEILHENSIISYPSVFKMYSTIKKDDGKFLAGDYSVSPSMSYDKLRAAFKPKRATGTSWVTIPEGSTVDEIIEIMTSYDIGTREGYIDVINNYDFSYYWFVEEIPENPDRFYRLEGYLFPDTYEFYNSSSEETVINKMLARFNEVFAEDYRTKASELGYSIDQILTIASLIEKEAGKAADYRNVSSVFHNRLRNSANFPRLESDATVIYAMQVMADGVRPETVTPDDLKLDTPYNTYLYNGLTPGPIANPSTSAIRYALYPAETSFYYFIADDHGNTLFASGWQEHQNNIQKVKEGIK